MNSKKLMIRILAKEVRWSRSLIVLYEDLGLYINPFVTEYLILRQMLAKLIKGAM